MSLLNDHIEHRLARRQIPGLAIRLFRPGHPSLEKEWGLADIALQTPVTPGTRFRIGCLTKPIVALTILQLAEDGLLGLDDSLEKHLPAFTAHSHPGFRNITITQLLTHTSGLARGTYFEDARDAATLLPMIAKTPLVVKPGTDYKYSNWGYVLLGEICQQVTGIPATRYCTDRVLLPLGMNDTFFQLEEGEQGLATGYWDRWHFGFPDMSQPPEASGWFPIAPCASGLISTPDDLGRFIKGIGHPANGEEEQVFSPAIRERLFTKTGHKSAARFTSLCLYGEQVNGRDVWYFPGTNSGFSATFIYIPSLKITGIAMANRAACNSELKELLQVAIENTWPDVPAPNVCPAPPPYTSDLVNTSGEVLHLEVNSSAGSYFTFRNETVPLLTFSPRSYFQAAGDLCQYMFRLRTTNQEVYEVSRGNEWFTTETATQTLTDKKGVFLAGYTGLYEYPAFGRVEVLLRNEKLYLNFGVIYETLLIPAGKHTFRQKKGPFTGEEILFGPTGNHSDYFLLNSMKFNRLTH